MAYSKTLPLFVLLTSVVSATTARADDPAPKEIISKAIKAAGWDKSKGDFHAWKDVGKFNFQDMEFDYTAFWKVDVKTGRYRMDLKMEIGGQKIEIASIFNGERAFESMGDMKQDVTGEKLEYTKENGHQFRVISLKPLLTDEKFKLTSVPGKAVDGKETYAIKVEYPGRTAFTLSFEKSSGLCVKSEGMVPNEFEGWKKTLDESYFSDWKETAVGGAKFFMTMKTVRNGKPLLVSKMSEVTISEKPDWAKTAFEKP
ncbi:MAG: hypothetical protein U0798_02140 [Gemmataceae bacterium]